MIFHFLENIKINIEKKYFIKKTNFYKIQHKLQLRIKSAINVLIMIRRSFQLNERYIDCT